MSKILFFDAFIENEDNEIRLVLERYFNILERKCLPKFKILRAIEYEKRNDNSIEELLKIHDNLMEIFYEELNNEKIRSEKHPSLLDLKIEIAKKILENCELCEWKCHVNRIKGRKGFCSIGKEMLISSEFVHMGEESFITPSHTIFFYSCNMQCIFCQNYTISFRLEPAEAINPKELARIIDLRRREGCRNVNLVGGEPTPHLLNILKTFKYVKENTPVIWNSNMYMSEICMKLLDGFVDVYLTDFKFGPGKCSEKLTKVKNYWKIVCRNHLIASKQAEIVIRHLVLPNHIECCSFPILEWISKNLGRKCIVNIMDQYYPCFKAKDVDEINRRIKREEYERVLEKAKELNLIVKS